MAKVNVSIPDALLHEVDDLAAELASSRSGFVQEATARYVAQLREDRAERERQETIAKAMEGARRLSASMLPGPDTTALIRADRDSDHGRAASHE
jgi:metal-responsive CopG/Arc/MetJ family transcriptional regulator